MIAIGCTRCVLLVGKYAIKFPVLSCWEMFLKGLVANIEEGKWSRFPSKHLPKTYYVARSGFISIQERVRPVRHEGLYLVDLAQLCAQSEVSSDFWLRDAKASNFGYRGNTLVKVDYA